MLTVPPSLLRNETHFRSGGAGPSFSTADCGLILKREARDGYRDRPQKHSFVAVYVLRGTGRYIDDQGRAFALSPGALVSHTPGRLHSMLPDGNGQWAEFFVQVPVAMWQMLSETGVVPSRPEPRWPGLDVAIFDQIEHFVQVMRVSTDPREGPRLLAEAHRLLVALYQGTDTTRRHRPHEQLIDEACQALADPKASAVQLSQLIERHGLSPERFRKVFRQEVGLPPGEYRIRRRIDQARTMIAEQQLTAKEVAFALGYPDPFTFSKQFKKYVGVSPSAFGRQV